MKNLLIFAFICLSFVTKAANFTSTSAGGDWASSTTWTLVSGTDADGIPDSNDGVTIDGTVTIGANSDCSNLSVPLGKTLTITSNILSVYGTFSMLGTLGGVGTLRFRGGIAQSINDAFITTANLRVGTSSTNLTINANVTFADVTVDASTTLTIAVGTTLTGTGALSNSGTLTNAGTVSITGTSTISGTTTVSGTFNGTANITNNGTSSILTISAVGIINALSAFTNDGSMTNDGTLNTTGTLTLSAGSTTGGVGVYNVYGNLTSNATSAITTTLATVNLGDDTVGSGTQTLSGTGMATITTLDYPAGSNESIRISVPASMGAMVTFVITNANFNGSGSVALGHVPSGNLGTATINFTNLANNLSGNVITFNSTATYGVITSYTVNNSSSSKTLTNNGTITITNATLSNAANTIFDGSGTTTITTLTSSATSGTRFSGTGTINLGTATFSGSGAVTMGYANTPTINITTLTQNGTGILTFSNNATAYGTITSFTLSAMATGGDVVVDENLSVTTMTFSNTVAQTISGTGNLSITTLNCTGAGDRNFDGTSTTYTIGTMSTASAGVTTLQNAGATSFNITSVNHDGTGNFTNKSASCTIGTLTINGSGTQVLDGTGNYNVTTLTVPSTKSSLLRFRGTAVWTVGTFTTNAGSTTTLGYNASPSFSITNFNAAQSGTLQLGATTSTSTINVTNFTITASGATNFGNGTNPTIHITNIAHNGSTTVTFEASATYGTISSMTLNTVGVSDQIDLNKSLTVTSLTLTRGRISLSAAVDLTISSLSGGSNNSFVATVASGSRLRRTISGSTTFPVGYSNAGASYTPVTVNPGTSMDTGVNVKGSDGANASVVSTDGASPSQPNDPTKIVNIEYEISNINAASVSAGSVTLGWQSNHQRSAFSLGSAFIVHKETNWTQKTSGSVSGSGTNANPYLMTATGLTSFSPFAIFSTGALPVELVSFVAVEENGNARLTWQTLSERNNRGFDIEKSLDAKYFYKIGTKDGAGTSEQTRVYSFIDDELSDVSYYRLKQVDMDGGFTYSKIAVVVPEGATDELMVSPNPSKDKLKISIKGTIQQVNLLNLNGQTVLSNSAKTIDIANLPDGMYLLQVITENGIKTKKVVKQL